MPHAIAFEALSGFDSSPRRSNHEGAAAAGPRAPFGLPVRNPFLNLRATIFKCRIRPVPVVFLRLAFSLHSSVQVDWDYTSPWRRIRILAGGAYTFESLQRDIHTMRRYVSECGEHGGLWNICSLAYQRQDQCCDQDAKQCPFRNALTTSPAEGVCLVVALAK